MASVLLCKLHTCCAPRSFLCMISYHQEKDSRRKNNTLEPADSRANNLHTVHPVTFEPAVFEGRVRSFIVHNLLTAPNLGSGAYALLHRAKSTYSARTSWKQCMILPSSPLSPPIRASIVNDHTVEIRDRFTRTAKAQTIYKPSAIRDQQSTRFSRVFR